jgi:hypothetical protein
VVTEHDIETFWIQALGGGPDARTIVDELTTTREAIRGGRVYRRTRQVAALGADSNADMPTRIGAALSLVLCSLATGDEVRARTMAERVGRLAAFTTVGAMDAESVLAAVRSMLPTPRA